MVRRLAILLVASLVLAVGCASTEEPEPRLSLFVGVDVSGSFTQARAPLFEDSLRFLAYYIYGHLHGTGGLEKVRALYVGPLGGNVPNEPKALFPIQVFERMSVPQIEAKLKEMFVRKGNFLTDFNAFFKNVSETAQKQNLLIAPLAIVVVTDGIPEVAAKSGKAVEVSYGDLDVSSLEFLARNVTIRVLYPSPIVAAGWEREIPRQRVRIWTVNADVMKGWREQLAKKPTPEEETRLWKWIEDIVNQRVRRQRIL